jgi:hypothetical protein
MTICLDNYGDNNIVSNSNNYPRIQSNIISNTIISKTDKSKVPHLLSKTKTRLY